MTMLKTATLSIAAIAAVAAAASPAAARPHRHQVCHIERHHGHGVRVCHWVR